jgi:hypothetical protein
MDRWYICSKLSGICRKSTLHHVLKHLGEQGLTKARAREVVTRAQQGLDGTETVGYRYECRRGVDRVWVLSAQAEGGATVYYTGAVGLEFVSPERDVAREFTSSEDAEGIRARLEKYHHKHGLTFGAREEA